MGVVILKIFILLIICLGVIMIFDARLLTKRLFGFGDQNDASAGLKIFGFIIAIAGTIGLIFIK